jgi:hypothetical protein
MNEYKKPFLDTRLETKKGSIKIVTEYYGCMFGFTGEGSCITFTTSVHYYLVGYVRETKEYHRYAPIPSAEDYVDLINKHNKATRDSFTFYLDVIANMEEPNEGGSVNEVAESVGGPKAINGQ